MEKWVLKKRNFWPEEIRKKFGLSAVISEILARRSFESEEQIDRYVNKNIEHVHDPFLLFGMQKSVEKLGNILSEGKKILIALDYDVDGIISGAIAYRGLTHLGMDCECIFPHRIHDGYGLNNRIVQYAIDHDFETILTFDNGVSSFEAINFANESGIDVIVTDHHEIPQILNEGSYVDNLVSAYSIINPKQERCNYPFKKICAGMIAYKLVQALTMYLRAENGFLDNLYPLVSIATICDVMSLEDENRIFVYYGLQRLNKIHNPGLHSLMRHLNIKEPVSASDIGFKVGPCINASGRLDSAEKAFRLLITDNLNEAHALAQDLVELNNERKRLTAEATRKAVQIVGSDDLIRHNIIIVILEDTHESLAGIVAGRLKELYGLPTIVFTKTDEMYKGSARSVEGLDIFEILSGFKDYFVRFGGHTAAAGLSIDPENMDRFKEAIYRYFTSKVLVSEKVLQADCLLPFEQISLQLAESLNIFEPTGKDNPQIIFSSLAVEIADIFFLGEKGNALKIIFVSANSRLSFITFDPQKILGIIKSRMNFEPDYDIIHLPKTQWCKYQFDILYKMGINRFNGNNYLQLELISIR